MSVIGSSLSIPSGLGGGGGAEESPTPSPRGGQPSPRGPDPSNATAEDFLAWLTSDRRLQELQLVQAVSVAKIRSPLSTMRLEGLVEVRRVMRGAKDQSLDAFLRLQHSRDDNLVQSVVWGAVLNSLASLPLPSPATKAPAASPPPSESISPEEVLVALDVLTGVSLLHHGTKRILALDSHGLDICLASLELLSNYVSFPPALQQIVFLGEANGVGGAGGNILAPRNRSATTGSPSLAFVFDKTPMVVNATPPTKRDSSPNKRPGAGAGGTVEDYRWALAFAPATALSKAPRRANSGPLSANGGPLVPAISTASLNALLVGLGDFLLSLLVDSEASMREFTSKQGLLRLVSILRFKQAPHDLRAKIADMLVFLVRYFTHYKDENLKGLQGLIGAPAVETLLACIQAKDAHRFDPFIAAIDLIGKQH